MSDYERRKEFFIESRVEGGKPYLIRATARKSVKGYCLKCKGFRGKDVQNCRNYECALYGFRTNLTNRHFSAIDIEVGIAQHCLNCSGGQRLDECKNCWLSAWFRFVTEDEAKAWKADVN